MATRAMRTLEVRTRQEWRDWLERHHASESEVWLVFPKRHTAVREIDYDAAVEEAICFGWIDSLVKRLDDERYARKFTPRKLESRWSTINRRRYADLESKGLLAAAGLGRPPTNRTGDAPKRSARTLPPYIEKHFRANPTVWSNFARLAPSKRATYIGWIDSAKRQDTKERRLREAMRLLAAGKELGLK
jgi:uncharacterized protein YdeI (YjbR/CyaY-like superfamily)